MQLKLQDAKIETFEEQMGNLAPWYHSFQFDDDIIVGFYKYHGLSFDLTWVNRKSAKSDIEKMKKAYTERNEALWGTFFGEILDTLPIQNRDKSTILDISSSTGKNSIYCVNNGFGKVIASEIRPNTSEQHRLIIESLEDEKYKQKIELINDPLSADDPDYPQRYTDENIDVVLSLNLLYHVTNPYQHIENLKHITKKYAVLYTKTHHNRHSYNSWNMTLEKIDLPTQAMYGVGWTPHFLAVKELCEKVGFKIIGVKYPTPFMENFPHFVTADYHTAERKMRMDQFLYRFLKIKRGYCTNHDRDYFEFTNLDPRYFAFILESV